MRSRIKRRRRADRPELTVADILAWADEHHRRTGRWPTLHSGKVRGSLNEKWRNIDGALRIGLRGLPGKSSLAQLLAEKRGVRNLRALPPISTAQILAWADAHYRHTGRWPTSQSGPIRYVAGETWRGMDQALRLGLRGLPGGSSLAQLLEKERGVRNLHHLPRLTIKQILAWAEAHHRRTGRWPDLHSGDIPEAPGENWKAIATALQIGRRGLPGGSSLARLLAEAHGVRNRKQLPRLTVKQILAWARAHRRRTGQWPTRHSGPIPEAPGESWSAIHAALSMGGRGLPAGCTLAGLIAERRAVPHEPNLPRLTVKQILAWADEHHRRTGQWPHARSGPIPGTQRETWRTVDHALIHNLRGLNVGLTLTQLLTQHRGIRTRKYPPPLTEQQILQWAREHRERTGEWPSYRSGPIPGVPGETWRSVDSSIRQGARGLQPGGSLAQLLARRGGARNRTNLPPLNLRQIVAWAVAHHKRTGKWPNSRSGPIPEAPGETWKGVDLAMRGGYRGLKPGVTLARLLAQERNVRNRVNLPMLTCEQILAWAEAHHRRTGEWPTRASGPVYEAPEETWSAIEMALARGHRGLPGGQTIATLLKHRGR
jgi:pyrroloquinoline quinone (PQQ) biosynthesis protein C